jgi:transcriptional regulator GlxA family with amidase domain
MGLVRSRPKLAAGVDSSAVVSMVRHSTRVKLARRFPGVTVGREAIYVRDRPILTAVGSAPASIAH